MNLTIHQRWGTLAKLTQRHSALARVFAQTGLNRVHKQSTRSGSWEFRGASLEWGQGESLSLVRCFSQSLWAGSAGGNKPCGFTGKLFTRWSQSHCLEGSSWNRGPKAEDMGLLGLLEPWEGLCGMLGLFSLGPSPSLKVHTKREQTRAAGQHLSPSTGFWNLAARVHTNWSLTKVSDLHPWNQHVCGD